MGSLRAWRGAVLVLGGALVLAACSDEPTVWSDDLPGGAAGDGASAGSSSVAGSAAGHGGSSHAGSSNGGSAGHRAGSGGMSHEGGAAGSPEPGSAGDGGTAGITSDGGQPPIGGAAGGGGDGGGGGEPPVVGGDNRALGKACINDLQCAPDLQCVKPTSGLLGGGSPPKGVCSKPCTADDTCSAVLAGALCVPFGDASSGYCMEGCEFGDPGLAVKCHDRPEFACLPALIAPTNAVCDESSECDAGEVCSGGVCNVVFTACLPSCRGDIDCAEGLYCDESFLGGTCVAEKPTGKKLGEPCTVPGPNDPTEPDGCLGFCQADSSSGNAGHCARTCGLGYECGYDSDAKKYGGVCLYATALTDGVGSLGDFGYCTPSCNCTQECDGQACIVLDEGPLSEDSFLGPGLCFAADSGSNELEACE